ncbi:unnamed protein product [Rangifer tarandus platyrhynchus]|uniref:Uncharacterized protein n=1 Tax=Rangifer tarandus platyrhynchus TaxID=3082113 RepID=A0AC59ZFG0_RANTA
MLRNQGTTYSVLPGVPALGVFIGQKTKKLSKVTCVPYLQLLKIDRYGIQDKQFLIYFGDFQNTVRIYLLPVKRQGSLILSTDYGAVFSGRREQDGPQARAGVVCDMLPSMGPQRALRGPGAADTTGRPLLGK